MKTILICLFSALLIISCHSAHKVLAKKQMKESYVYAFKMAFCKQVLLFGFNKSEEIKTILIKDRSGYGEPILLATDIQLIDSLTNAANNKMVQDSTRSIGKVAEGAEGKRVFDYLFTTFHSKWLDSIADARLKLYQESK